MLESTSVSASGDLVAVAPNDNTPVTANTADGRVNYFRAIYVGVTGDVTLITRAGQTVLLKALVAGVFHPVQGNIIKATGTTATNIVAAY